MALSNLGDTLSKLERYIESENYLQSARKIFEDLGDLSTLAATLLNLAELYQKRGATEQAMQYCNEALSISNELDIPLLRDCQHLATQLSIFTSQD
jgi:tetratricopeptide (TPR) repeat protein